MYMCVCVCVCVHIYICIIYTCRAPSTALVATASGAWKPCLPATIDTKHSIGYQSAAEFPLGRVLYRYDAL